MGKELIINTDYFMDTSEVLFGKNIFADLDLTEAVGYFTLEEFKTKVLICAEKVRSLGVALKLDRITEIKLIDDPCRVGGLRVIGQNEYRFEVNRKVLNKQKINYLISMIYHELCHLYQLNRLFNENIIYWYPPQNQLRRVENKEEIANKHLQENKGHALYWLELANIINTRIKPVVPVKAILSKDELTDLFLESFFIEVENNDVVLDPEFIEWGLLDD